MEIVLNSERVLNPNKIRINIDLTEYLPGRISQEILNNPKKAKPPYFIQDYELRTSCSFRDIVEKKVKLFLSKVKQKIKDNPVIYIYNEYMKLSEKVENNDDLLITHYHLGKLKPKYTIKISKKENEQGSETEENNEDNLQTESVETEVNNNYRPFFTDIVTIYNEKPKEKKTEKNYLYIVGLPIILVVILIGLVTGIYFLIKFLKKKEKQSITNNQEFKEEKLIFQPNYAPNLVYRIKGTNMRNITFNSEDIKNNEPQIIKEYYDVVMGIFDQNEEIKDNIKYEYYNAFISVLNITVENKTNIILSEYDKNISKILNQKNLRRMENLEDISNIPDNNTKPFMKFDFYKNGKIKQMYLPFNLSDTYLTYLQEIIEVIIPRINTNLFSSDINKTFDNYYQNYSKLNEDQEEEEENETNYEDEDEADDEYNTTDNAYRIRNLEENFTEVNISNLTSDTSTSLLESEDSQQTLDLREYTPETNDPNSSNISTINQIQFSGGKSKYGEAKGSSINTTINTVINETAGIFSYVYYIQESLLNNELGGDSTDESVYDENNGITRIMLNDSDDSLLNEINISLSSINTLYNRSLQLVNFYKDENFVNQMKDYLSEFSYEIYNENENSAVDLTMRRLEKDFLSSNIFEDKEIIIEKNIENGKKQLRKLSDDSYYGIKPFKNEKYLFKFNLLFEISLKMVTEQWPKDGKCKSYFLLKIGFISIKITLSNIQTNLHLVIKNTQEMTRKLISLVNESNENLLQRNQNYSEIIINFEKNITEMFKESYDFSNFFREPLNNMYDNIKNFTGSFFMELIHLIDNATIEYKKIDEQVKKDKFEFILTIRNITKMQYISYIKNMLFDLEKFKNNTLLFLDNITYLMETIENFQIDVLYDIQDQIIDCKIIFQNFMTNLYKSIEKGIKIFKYDLYDYIEEIIGELLYTIDFLSYNINKNEILIKALDESIRLSAQEKLKSFRYTINSIVDYIYNNIMSDYEKEMSVSNQNSIKYFSKKKVEDYLSIIENKSSDVITKIKAKIQLIELYELYVNNIDLIKQINDDVQQKLFDVVYDNVFNLSKIKSEILNKSSNINIQKEKLFDISNKIIDFTNSEIKEINEYIINYSKEYKMKYEYLLDLNLYYFRKSFLDEPLTNLYNEFDELVNKTIKEYIVSVIQNNYKLGSQYVNDVFNYVYGHRRYTDGHHKNGYTAAYTKRFSGQMEKFENFLFLTYSEEFAEVIGKNYYYLKNKIISYVDEKIKSIDSYYFYINLYKKNFYFLDQIANEIYNLTDNINNYFTDDNLEYKIKIKALQTTQEVLQPIDDKLLKEYQYPNSRINNYINWYTGDTSTDCKYAKYRFLKGRKWHRRTFASRKNIDKIIDNLTTVDKYMESNVDLICSNFINKFDYYLKNIVNYSQIFYEDLYKYVENKINNDTNLSIFLDDYNIIYNSMINNESNLELFFRLYNKIQFKSDFDLINKYVEKMDDIYYKLYYLNNKSSFLEYPIEIVNSTSQLKSELINNKNFLKDNINLLYRQFFNNIIIETNNYINNFNTFNLEYILSLSKHNEIMKNYTIKKYSFIKEKFQINELNLVNLSNYALNSDNQDFFLNITNKTDFILRNIDYDSPINNILNYYDNYSAKIIGDINETFIIKNCTEYNETVTINGTEEYKIYNVCNISFYVSDKNYSRYNYNIVKLRTAIYYTKYLAQDINSIYNNYNFENILNISSVLERDQILNDKNIFNLFNETNNILTSINEKSLEIIEEPQLYLEEAFKKKYTYRNDYIPYINYFYDIINFKNNTYNENVISYMNNIKKEIKVQIDYLKQNLNKQLLNTKNYTEYNFDSNNLNKTFYYFVNEITKSFTKYKDEIINLNNSYDFHNSIKDLLRELQIPKRAYFKKLFDEQQKNYDFPFMNISMDLGEIIENYMEKDFQNYCFENIYDYVEIFINSTVNYQNNIIEILKIIENEILFNITKIYNDFYYEFNNNKNDNITPEYIVEYTNNYTSCLNYSYDNLNITINEDKLVYEEYLQKLQLLKLLNESKYMNYTNFTNVANYTNNTINETDLLNLTYFNKTEYLLFCHENNYFNKSLYYYADFDINIKNKLNSISKNIDLFIQKYIIDEEYLTSFLKNNIKELENYTESIDDLNYYIDDIASMSFYANAKYELPTYKNLLIDLSYKFFNESYSNYINKFIKNDVDNKINIYFLQPLLNKLNCIENRIVNEFGYYKLLLNNTNEIGYTSKDAFMKLCQILKNKLNESVYELLEEYIDDNFYFFYRENKKVFRNVFINYILNNNILQIYKLEEFIDEILFDHDIGFNNTLDQISSTFINDNIIYYFKNKIYVEIKNKLDIIFTKIDNNEIELSNILNNITTKYYDEDMEPIVNEVNKYSIIVNNQSNKFSFSFGNETFDAMYSFVNNSLKPPILTIENFYNQIQELLLQKIEEIVKTFPDGYQTVIDNLILDKKLQNINETLPKIEYYFKEYYDKFNNDLNSYYNKLIRFSFIDGLRTFDNDIDYRLDLGNSRVLKEITKSKNNNSENKETYIYKKYKNKTIAIEEFNKYKRKLSYSDDEYVSKINIQVPALLIQNNLNKFNKSYISSDYNRINTTLIKHLSRIQTYLVKMSQSFEFTLLKFSTFLTKNCYAKLKDLVQDQYYKIEDFINNNYSTILPNSINNFMIKLNLTSFPLSIIYNSSYDQIFNYYDSFYEMINDKFKIIDDADFSFYAKWNKDKDNINADGYETKTLLDLKDLENLKDLVSVDMQQDDEQKYNTLIFMGEHFQKIVEKFTEIYEIIIENVMDIKKSITNLIGNLFAIHEALSEEGILEKISDLFEGFELDGIPTIDGKHFNMAFKKGISIKLDYLKNLIPPIPLFIPYLYLQIIPEAEVHFNIKIGTENTFKSTEEEEAKNLIYIDCSAGGSFSVSAEAAFGMELGAVTIEIGAGLKGILGEGDFGIKIDLEFREVELTIDIYYIYIPFQLNFYVVFRLEVNCAFFSFEFEFYLLNMPLIGFKIEKHSLSSVKPTQQMLSNMVKKNLPALRN